MRPLERAILRRVSEGQSTEEIASRFKMGSDHVDRVISYTKLPGRTGVTSGTRDGLRPLERRVLYWLDRGLSHDEIGIMFRRSGEHIRRVEGWAYLRKGFQILGG